MRKKTEYNQLTGALWSITSSKSEKTETETKTTMMFVCLLVAYRPSNMRVYLRDGSAQTILRAATLR